MNTGIATIADTFRRAKEKIESAKTSSEGSEFGKWIIIAAAVFAALMVMRGLRGISRVAFGLFWVWFWTHGAWHHIF